MPFSSPLPALPWAPVLLTLTRSVVPVSRSRTKTSTVPSVSPGTRLSDKDANAMYRPSALTAGSSLSCLPWAPALETLSSSVKPGAGWAAAPTAGTSAAAATISAARQDLGICSSFAPLEQRCRTSYGSDPGSVCGLLLRPICGLFGYTYGHERRVRFGQDHETDRRARRLAGTDPRARPPAHPRCRPGHRGGVEMGEAEVRWNPGLVARRRCLHGRVVQAGREAHLLSRSLARRPEAALQLEPRGEHAARDRHPRRGEDRRSRVQAAHPRSGGGERRSPQEEVIRPAGARARQACSRRPTRSRRRRAASAPSRR